MKSYIKVGIYIGLWIAVIALGYLIVKHQGVTKECIDFAREAGYPVRCLR